jgi:hypothetical protein
MIRKTIAAGNDLDVLGVAAPPQVRRRVLTLNDLWSSRVRDILFVAFVTSCARIPTLTGGDEVGMRGEDNSLCPGGPRAPCHVSSAELLGQSL